MKYPRTFHLPWSPGATSDDKIMQSVEGLINQELIISEKLDGSNCCFSPQGIFARSHAGPPKHPSFDLLKQRFFSIQHLLKENEEIFLENCFAVHSLTYQQMPDFCFVLNIRQNGQWLSWPEVTERSQELKLTPAPVLFTGSVKSKKELETLTATLAVRGSIYGGEQEGVVVRVKNGFSESDFSTKVGKIVRANHVQTDVHWTQQIMVKQNFHEKNK